LLPQDSSVHQLTEFYQKLTASFNITLQKWQLQDIIPPIVNMPNGRKMSLSSQDKVNYFFPQPGTHAAV